MTVEIRNKQVLYTQDNIRFVNTEALLPNGLIIHKALIEHPGAVAIVPILDNGEVLLIRQYRLAVDQYLLEIPAGTMEPDEDPRRCAERELQEEAGYFPGELIELGGFFVAPGLTSEYIHLYLARDLRPASLAQDQDEIIEVISMSLTRALNGIKSGEIQDAKTIIGLLRVE